MPRPIFQMIENNDVDGFIKHIEKNPNEIYTLDPIGNTPLINACTWRCTEIVRAILDVDCSKKVINAKDNWFNTALINAATMGNLDIITAILQKNSSLEIINATDLEDSTVLMEAAAQGNIDIVKAILEKNSSLEVINAKNSNKKTALILAVTSDNKDIVTTLLEINSSLEVINSQDEDGNSALTYAIKRGNKEIINAIFHPFHSKYNDSIKKLQEFSSSLHSNQDKRFMEKLINDFDTAGNTFFQNISDSLNTTSNPSEYPNMLFVEHASVDSSNTLSLEEPFNRLKEACERLNRKSATYFKPSVWKQLKPILKGILGVVLAIAATLATCGFAIIPIVVDKDLKNKYINTFFKAEDPSKLDVKELFKGIESTISKSKS